MSHKINSAPLVGASVPHRRLSHHRHVEVQLSVQSALGQGHVVIQLSVQSPLGQGHVLIQLCIQLLLGWCVPSVLPPGGPTPQLVAFQVSS